MAGKVTAHGPKVLLDLGVMQLDLQVSEQDSPGSLGGAFKTQALAEFNLYRGDPVATVDRALAAAPRFVMAHALKAYLLGLATEQQDAVTQGT